MGKGSGYRYAEVPPDNKDSADVHEEIVHSKSRSFWSLKNFKGWKYGVLNGAVVAFIVLAVNVAATAYAMTRSSRNAENDSRRSLYTGDCETVRKLNVGIHFLINVLSTILLGASNYSMQCMSAPTRSEVDRWHARKQWLDIGVFSMRNIGKISKWRTLLWALLAVSSLPLHLFFNSVVHASTYTQDYQVYEATKDMIYPNSSTFGTYMVSNTSGIPQYFQSVEARELLAKAVSNKLERLENKDCIDAYATVFPTERASVILITENAPEDAISATENVDYATIGMAVVGLVSEPFQWICDGEKSNDQLCQDSFSSINPATWAPFGDKVLYCLSDSFEPQCKLQMLPQIAGIVIACNVIKVLVMVFIFFGIQEMPLITIGDAIASFLRNPDQTTTGLCLMGKDDIKLWSEAVDTPPSPQEYSCRRRKWSEVASTSRWVTCLFVYGIAITFCIVLLFYGLFAPGKGASASQLMSLDIGAIDPRAFVYSWDLPTKGPAGIFSNILIANTPQVLLSVIYFTYNGLFTCFLLGNEWDQFGHSRKGIRISGSFPHGAQKAKYFLQLPYRFALPLMAISGLLHWFCSQSIFVVSLSYLHIYFDGEGGKKTPGEYISCGYSPRAVLGVIIIGLALVAGIVFAGRRRYQGVIPMVGSCSASISAMCHTLPMDDGEDLSLRRLQWGVVGSEVVDGGISVGHCSFSNVDVAAPVEGQIYAGGVSGGFADKSRIYGRHSRQFYTSGTEK